MGWGIGQSCSTGRDIGYMVPATCDQPDCNEEIDRGISYCCGGFEGAVGCGLYFCGKHLSIEGLCDRCSNDEEPYDEKPDLPRWEMWKLRHYSWEQWRRENRREVTAIKLRLQALPMDAFTETFKECVALGLLEGGDRLYG